MASSKTKGKDKMTAQEKSVPAAPKTTTTMTDGKEISFGKKKALFNVKHEDGVVVIHAAHSDGEYRAHTLSADDHAKWAAYGLRAYAKSKDIQHSADFDTKLNAETNPFDVVQRHTVGPKPLPIELALVQVTGKDLTQVRAFLFTKSRKEVNALKADARIAPVYAALQAQALAEVAAKKAAKDPTLEEVKQSDLLADLS